MASDVEVAVAEDKVKSDKNEADVGEKDINDGLLNEIQGLLLVSRQKKSLFLQQIRRIIKDTSL